MESNVEAAAGQAAQHPAQVKFLSSVNLVGGALRDRPGQAWAPGAGGGGELCRSSIALLAAQAPRGKALRIAASFSWWAPAGSLSPQR